MLNTENNELYYHHPDGTIKLGQVVAPPKGQTWTLCTIKIGEGHYGIYTGESILQAQLNSEEAV